MINIDNRLSLELTTEKFTTALYGAIDNNRAHLCTFLPWVKDMKSEDDCRSYLKTCEQLYAAGKEVSYVIIFDGIPAGRIGLHYINNQNRNASIGYWVTKSAEGKGLIIKSCQKLISYGFQTLNLKRIEIKAAVENIRSQAIPQKLGFKQEGILRRGELVNNKFLDLVLYSMLDEEWNEITINR